MRLAAVASLLVAATSVFAAPIQVPFEKYTLPNGLKVILHVDRTVPLATINTWFYVGSKDEPVRRSGFAHLFEHLMFMGTERVPVGQYDARMEAFGAQNNASTTQDRTNYFSFGPSNTLPLLLWLDADRLEDLGRMMDQKKLDLQRDVVRNERRERTENTPYGAAYDALNALMFPPNHPYFTTVIGSHEDLEAATVNDVKEFFARYYVPNNASLVVAGDFDPKTVKPLIAKYFGTLPRGNDIVRKPTPPVAMGLKRLTMVDKVSETKVMMAFHSPKAYSIGDVQTRMMENLLTDEGTGMLYRSLIAEQGLATSVASFTDAGVLGSILLLEATVAPGKTRAQLEKAMDAELRKFASTPVSAADLKRLVAREEATMARSLQSLDEKADVLNEYEYFLGNPDSFEKVLNMYRSVTPASLMKQAKAVLTLDKRVVLTVIPEAEKPEVNPRATAPTVGASAPWAYPTPTTLKLKNGVEVEYFARPGVPLLSVRAVMGVGTWLDPRGKEGLTAATFDMLTLGAGKRNELEALSLVDQIGARLSISARVDHAEWFLEVPLTSAAVGLGLLSDTIARPRFDTASWKTQQAQILGSIMQSYDEPDFLANLALREIVLAGDDPYRRPATGTRKTIQSFNAADLRSFFEQNVKGRTFKIFAAGGASVSEVKALLDASLGAILATIKTSRFDDRSTSKPGPQTVIVDRPNAAQTLISMQIDSLPAISAERTALEAVTNILGGSFTSRLMLNLREDKGYTYSASARLTADQGRGVLEIGAAVKSDVTGASLREFFKELKLIAEGQVSEQDLAKAKQLLRTDVIQSASSVGRLARTAADAYSKGLGSAEVRRRLALVDGLTLQQLQSVARSAYRLDHLKIALVGDRKLIEAQIAELNLANVSVFKPSVR